MFLSIEGVSTKDRKPENFSWGSSFLPGPLGDVLGVVFIFYVLGGSAIPGAESSRTHAPPSRKKDANEVLINAGVWRVVRGLVSGPAPFFCLRSGCVARSVGAWLRSGRLPVSRSNPKP